MTSHKTHFQSESLTPFPLSLFHSTTFSFVSLFPISFPSSFSSSLVFPLFLSLYIGYFFFIIAASVSESASDEHDKCALPYIHDVHHEAKLSKYTACLPKSSCPGRTQWICQIACCGTPGCSKTTLARLKTDVCHLLSHTSAQQYAPTNVHAHKSSEETKTLRENKF